MDRFCNQLGYILRLQGRLHAFYSVFEHLKTKGAGDPDHLGIGKGRLFQAHLVDPRACVLLHPGMSPAPSAAEASFPGRAHLRGLETGYFFEYFSRRVIDRVVTSKVAGIVIRYRSIDRFGGSELILLQPAADHFRMMKYLKLPVKLGIFILERFEAMGTVGDDLLDAAGFQGLNILLGHELELQFVTDPAGRVPAAHLGRPQDAEVDSRRLHYPGQGNGHLDVSFNQRSRTSHPVEPFRLAARGEILDLQSFRPAVPGELGSSPRISADFHIAQGVLDTVQKFLAGKDLMSSHVDVLVDLLDKHRTALLARPAGCAIPKLL